VRISQRHKHNARQCAGNVRVVIDPVLRVPGRVVAPREVEHREERSRNGNGDGQDQESTAREICDRSEQHCQDRAGGPERGVVRLITMLDAGANAASQQTGEVQRDEPGRADDTLERECERVESDEIEKQMRDIGVDEAAGQQPRVAASSRDEIGAQHRALQQAGRDQCGDARHDDHHKYR